MFEYLFHYQWDYTDYGYTRWVKADSDEEAIRTFYKERPDALNVWYEIYRYIIHEDGYKSLVLDM